MRFTGHRYRDCRWCHGAGCLYCEGEADKAYKRAFPDGPVPIATFDDTPEGMAAARQAVGREAIEKEFGPEGDGLVEILRNITNRESSK